MSETSITGTEAVRNFADCVNRAHYQRSTFILLKNGKRFARITPDGEKQRTGQDLATVLSEASLSEDDARTWHGDLIAARQALNVPGLKVVEPK